MRRSLIERLKILAVVFSLKQLLAQLRQTVGCKISARRFRRRQVFQLDIVNTLLILSSDFQLQFGNLLRQEFRRFGRPLRLALEVVVSESVCESVDNLLREHRVGVRELERDEVRRHDRLDRQVASERVFVRLKPRQLFWR